MGLNLRVGRDQSQLTVAQGKLKGTGEPEAPFRQGLTAERREDGAGGSLGYETSHDLAQGTGFQNLTQDIGNDNDQNLSGYLHLFNPASTTFVKHFIAKSNSSASNDRSFNDFIAGYCNVTAAIDAVQFKMSSGNIDAGTIKLYGLKDS